MQLLDNAQGRLTVMLLLTTTFFMVEIIVGYITNSMALIADSFHMFSDAIALVIAFISVRMSPKKWSKNTFGWARAEILGALVNAVFLCALCFSILIESIKRFVKPDMIHEPRLILIVGGLGLFINLVGLLLFKEHHHMHHHHHHHHHAHHGKSDHHHHLSTNQESEMLVCQDDKLETDSQKIKYGLLCKHRGHTDCKETFCSETANHPKTSSVDSHEVKANSDEHLGQANDTSHKHVGGGDSSASTDMHLAFRHPSKQHLASSSSQHCVDVHSGDEISSLSKKRDRNHHHQTSSQMNMHGVFLHVAADALGSVIVMISAIIVEFTDWAIKIYIDPILSVIMVCIILKSTWPLLTESAMILLQTVPTHIEVDSLRKRLTEEIQGVLAVHEFHIWQLAGDRIIASAHIRCHNLQDYMVIAEKVKEFFHNEGIHSTTIQPEFVDFGDEIFDSSNDNCALDCPPTQRPQCASQTCCGTQKGPEPSNVTVDSGTNESAAGGVLLRRSVPSSRQEAGNQTDSKTYGEQLLGGHTLQVISSATTV